MNYFSERSARAQENWNSQATQDAALAWQNFSRTIDYQYMFEWCGLPIIQDPQDIVLMHEVLWSSAPNIIVETGIARGGSLTLSASVLASLAYAGCFKGSPTPMVIGIDIDIRTENRTAIDSHPLRNLIHLIEGSSTADAVLAHILDLIPPLSTVAVILDSNHTHAHVLKELEVYSKLVSPGCPLLVMDTGIEFAPVETFRTERPWGPGNSPYSAVREFLESPAGENFFVDTSFQQRHLITSARDGLLWRGAR